MTGLVTFPWHKSTPGYCWRKSAKFSQAFVRRWGTVQLGCLDPGMRGCHFLTWKADEWSRVQWNVNCFCGCGSVICCSRKSQVVAFRISFECFLVGFTFCIRRKWFHNPWFLTTHGCFWPMVSPLDWFRFASVSWSHWFHFGIRNSKSPRSESLQKGDGGCVLQNMDGWPMMLPLFDVKIIENRFLGKFQASQAAEWYQACFPLHPCGSGDVMSFTSGKCQAEWNFG